MTTMNRRNAVRGTLAALVALAAALTLAAPAAPRASAASADPAFDQQVLDRANYLRAKHGVPPLTLNGEISGWAQEWADQLASSGQFAHRPNNKYGENLHYAWRPDGSSPTGAEVVDGWYNQVKDYHYYGSEPDMGTFKNWGLFTQVVWKSSARIGVGKATASGGKTYVVVNFDPPGNFINQFAANVLPPK
ncbi:secretion protein [Streptomyces roseirectus]|uniref:Secretion protein n=1 Tax=Streptomyces roseirectus TaxID=2768066 RepID=A0A7H0I7E4_9ACTN|nr:CAP family protein [Streptomyces roseirectus]QNP68710.1 secretion protein [Streptomyces roseirectus]